MKSIVEKDLPPLDLSQTELVTVGTEIAAPHKQQVRPSCCCSAAAFSLKSLETSLMMQ